MIRTHSIVLALAYFLQPIHAAAATPLGIFEDHGDLGTVLHPGAIEYDSTKRTYTLSGSGENMWFGTDAFQFVWKKVSGDVSLAADISFIGSGKEGHRKAVLMIRQSLDADSPYADVARHGDGLTSLQARDEKGAKTTEIQSATKAPVRVRIAKRGDSFYIWVAGEGEDLKFSGGSMRIPIHDPFYVGIGVCSHNKDTVEQAVFSNVDLTVGAPASASPPKLYSTLETVPLAGDRRAVYATEGRLESPVWRSNDAIMFHSDGVFEMILAAGGKPEALGIAGMASSGPIATGTNPPSDGFHNFSPQVSPDGRNIAFLSTSAIAAGIPEDQDVMLRVLSTQDGKVRVLAKFIGGKGSGPSWSPDSRKIAFISYQPVP